MEQDKKKKLSQEELSLLENLNSEALLKKNKYVGVEEDTEGSLPSALSFPSPSLETRYIACLVLAGVGDALGYHNGGWEFNHNGPAIHEAFRLLGGINKFILDTSLRVSDDQVMHLATAEALVESNSLDELFPKLAEKYVESFEDMDGRAPGSATSASIDLLKTGTKWNEIPFKKNRGGGCGAAMRSQCIGLKYFGENKVKPFT